MSPDFSKKTVDTLAKRAAFKCSNPDCRAATVGPNTDAQKATVIGEAAHIYGARSNASRYKADMTDTARADITNGIWLCRNCHKLIDTDEAKYTPEILFRWREIHEEFVATELSGATGHAEFEEQASILSQFEGYPHIIRRLVIDKPDGWEWRLTAELMRHLNKPAFRRMQDLRDGLYIKKQSHLTSDDVPEWLGNRLRESSNLTTPLNGLLNRLTESCGAPGEEGDVNEIHHTALLVRNYLEQVIEFEEQLYFTQVPDGYKKLIGMVKDKLASQMKQIDEIPKFLDEVFELSQGKYSGTPENPLVMEKVVTLDMPKNWSRDFNRELRKAKGYAIRTSKESSGCLFLLIMIAALWFFIMIF